MKNGIYKSLVVFIFLGLLMFTSVYFTDKYGDGNLNTQSSQTDRWVNAKEISTPKQMTFAGERVPLDRTDVFEQLEREIVVNTFYHSQTVLLIKKLPRYFEIIEPILKRNNIPEDFKYLAVAESGLSETAVSPARAVGLWQFMKSTGKECGLQINREVDERYNIEKSTQAACVYLKKSYEKFKSWSLVAASYNAGRSNVLQQMNRQKADNYFNILFNEETGRYVYRILALKTILSAPEKYGFYIKNTYPVVNTKKIKVDYKIEDLADFAHSHKISYKTLKNFNPWLRQKYLKNRKNNTYYITIPEDYNKFVTE